MSTTYQATVDYPPTHERFLTDSPNNLYQNAQNSINPLADFISDELYAQLRSNDLINEKAVRDYVIRRVFRKIKAEGRMRTAEAMEYIQGLYPYLQVDTIRKIVYGVYPTSSKKSML